MYHFSGVINESERLYSPHFSTTSAPNNAGQPKGSGKRGSGGSANTYLQTPLHPWPTNYRYGYRFFEISVVYPVQY